MDDGRVLGCEDADTFGRSYSNDCMYVYTPPEVGGTESEDGDGGEDEGENGDENEHADGEDDGNGN
jgi:hypothetical protein